MITRVVDFTAVLYELYFGADARPDEPEGSADSHTNGDAGSIRSLRLSTRSKDWTPDLSTPATTSESFQSFFAALEEDVAAYYNAAGSPTTLSKRWQEANRTDDEKAQGSSKPSNADKERKIRETMDIVERAVCSLFYDRLFAPEGSDDKSHDEALSSRVAALNMLDLTLEHLGVEAGSDAIAGVDKVVQAVGRGERVWRLGHSPALTPKSSRTTAARRPVLSVPRRES